MTLQELIDEANKLLASGVDPNAKVAAEVEFDSISRLSQGEDQESTCELEVESLKREGGLRWGVLVQLARR